MLPLSVRLYAVAAALLIAAVGLEVRRRSVTSRERSRFTLLRDDVELFVDALATSLRHPEVCTGILKGQKLKPGATEEIELRYEHDPARPAPLRAGADAWAGTQLRTLTLTLPPDPDMSTTYRGQALRRYRTRLAAEFFVVDRFPRGVPASLELITWLDDQNEVTSCFGPLSVGSVCNMMGGYYDVTARAGEPRCHQIAATTVGAGEAEVYRGSCRIRAVVDDPKRCRDRRGALLFQEKMGYGTEARALCRICE